MKRTALTLSFLLSSTSLVSADPFTITGGIVLSFLGTGGGIATLNVVGALALGALSAGALVLGSALSPNIAGSGAIDPGSFSTNFTAIEGLSLIHI